MHASLGPSLEVVTAVLASESDDELRIGSFSVPQFRETSAALCHIGCSAHRVGMACELLDACLADCKRHCSEVSVPLREKLEAMQNVLRQHNSHSSAVEEDMLSLATTGIVRCVTLPTNMRNVA
jgi:hypothetical protein